MSRVTRCPLVIRLTGCYGFAFVTRFFPFVEQSLSGVWLIKNFRFEVDARRQVEIAVAGSGVAIDAAVLATLVRID